MQVGSSPGGWNPNAPAPWALSCPIKAGRTSEPLGLPHVQRAEIPIWTNKAGRIEDPAIDQLFQSMLNTRVKRGGTTQSMQVAIRIKTQFRRGVIAIRELLAGVTKRLKMTDSFRIVECRHCGDRCLCYQRARNFGLA